MMDKIDIHITTLMGATAIIALLCGVVVLEADSLPLDKKRKSLQRYS